MNETRYQELLGQVLDEEIGPAELDELSEALRRDPERLRDLQFHLVLWDLFSQQRRPERSPEAFMAAWRTRLAAESDASDFLARTVGLRSTREPEGTAMKEKPSLFSAPKRDGLARGWLAQIHESIRATHRPRWAAGFALATCLVVIAGVGIWCFGPTVGEPVVAEVEGRGVSLERSGEQHLAQAGMHLLPGDVLRTPDNSTATIGFDPERTFLTLEPGAEMKVLGIRHGKRLELRAGKLEASVARQRPFSPMVITTPLARACVLGTRFSLLVTRDSTRLEVVEGKVRLTRVSDGLAVQVPADHYAIVTEGADLAALPQTGGLLREWWTGMHSQIVFVRPDPRFPDHADGRDTVRDFELSLPETNRLGVRLCGYVHPPKTGDYRFWLECNLPYGTAGGELMMSPSENPSEAVPIAQTGRPGAPPSQTPPPIPLVAGRRYYIEAQIRIHTGGGRFAVAWQPPGESRRLLSGDFLSPYKPK